MVDFNNEQTVATPSWDVLKILVLEKRENVLLAVEFYLKQKFASRDQEGDLYLIRSRLWTLYYEMEGMLETKKSSEELQKLRALINHKEGDQVLSAFSNLNRFMYEINLTKLDTKRVYDKTRTERENATKDL